MDTKIVSTADPEIEIFRELPTTPNNPPSNANVINLDALNKMKGACLLPESLLDFPSQLL